jgi:hypothetical protein
MRVAEEDEAGADEEFWNQEFFKEEAADDDYQSEKEEEDVIDSDFDVSVRFLPFRKAATFLKLNVANHTRKTRTTARRTMTRKGNAASESPCGTVLSSTVPLTRPGVFCRKTGLRPPGLKKTKRPKAKPELPAPPEDTVEDDKLLLDGESQDRSIDLSYEVPTLRRSTRDRVAEAEKERQRLEKVGSTRCCMPQLHLWQARLPPSSIESAATVTHSRLARLHGAAPVQFPSQHGLKPTAAHRTSKFVRAALLAARRWRLDKARVSH